MYVCVCACMSIFVYLWKRESEIEKEKLFYQTEKDVKIVKSRFCWNEESNVLLYIEVHVESKHHAISATKQSWVEYCLCHGFCMYVNARQGDVWMSVSVSLERQILPRETARWRESKTQMTRKKRGKKRRMTAKCAETGG